MKWFTRIAPLILLLAFAIPVQANDRDVAAIVQYHRQYLKRAPSDAEINVWISDAYRTGATPEQVEAAIIASQEYYRRCGNNPRAWANRMFADVLDRFPTIPERNYLMNLLNDFGGDRERTALEFLVQARRGF